MSECPPFPPTMAKTDCSSWWRHWRTRFSSIISLLAELTASASVEICVCRDALCKHEINKVQWNQRSYNYSAWLSIFSHFARLRFGLGLGLSYLLVQPVLGLPKVLLSQFLLLFCLMQFSRLVRSAPGAEFISTVTSPLDCLCKVLLSWWRGNAKVTIAKILWGWGPCWMVMGSPLMGFFLPPPWGCSWDKAGLLLGFRTVF